MPIGSTHQAWCSYTAGYHAVRHGWYRFGREYRALQAMDGVGTDATSPSANIGWSGIGVERVLRSTD
jgi:hypothetical protein